MSDTRPLPPGFRLSPASAKRDNEALRVENEALRGALKAAQDALKAAQERRAEPDDALFRVVSRRMFDLALKHEGREGLKALLRELDEVARWG